MNYLNNFKFNISENMRKKYIWNQLHDYDEYIKREKHLFKSEISEINKQVIIANISCVYCEMGNYNKAIETIRLLDNYELNDDITFIYYVNSLLYYILNNEEENVDYIYEESQILIEKFSEKYPEQVDLYRIRYLIFKGRYEESLEVLKLNRIKNKDNDNMKLILADIAFNTDEYDEGYLIISEMCKDYNKKNPCIKKQIDTLINAYIRNVPIEKNESLYKMSLDNKLWVKVKESNSKTTLFFAYLVIKNFCKNKFIKYGVIPALIIAFLCKVLLPLVYGKGFSEIFENILSFLFLTYIVFTAGYFILKHSKKADNGFCSAITITLMVISILIGLFITDFKGSLMDLKYAISKTTVEENGRIEKMDLIEYSKGSTIKLKLKNKVFILHDTDYLYDYIRDNFKEGEKVKIDFLPNSLKIINMEKLNKKS